MGTIRFWGHNQPCFFLSNFYTASFDIDGKRWTSTEHYYQAMKAQGTEWEEKVRLLAKPKMAAVMGRSMPLRSDWEEVKEDVMRRAIEAKFTQNRALGFSLVDTGDEVLIEASPYDAYWGEGADRNGKNRLGVLLMELRSQLKSGL